MVEHATRQYTLTEIRDIVGLACDVSDLPSPHIRGMVCLADLLTHIAEQDSQDTEAQVRGFFQSIPAPKPDAFDALDD